MTPNPAQHLLTNRKYCAILRFMNRILYSIAYWTVHRLSRSLAS